MASNPKGAAGAFKPIAMIFVLGLVVGIVANLFFPFQFGSGIWIRLIGIIPLAIGLWLFASARSAFIRHKTSLMPWKPTLNIVQDGPYRFSRNPIYLAFALWYLGASLIFNSVYLVIILLIVLVLFDRLQIPREERYLEEKFGEEYTNYKSKVRRWI